MGYDYSKLMDVYKPDPKKPVSMIVYGKAGSGKTTLASTFPEPLFVDTNRGLKSLGKSAERIKMSDLDEPKLPSNPKPAFDTIHAILIDARNGTGPFAPGGKYAKIRTIVIDDITDLGANYLMGEILVANGKDRITGKQGFDEFGPLNRRLQTISNIIKDIIDLGKFNVIITALPHETTDEKTKVTTICPEILGGFRSIAAGYFDEEYYLEGETINDRFKVTLYASPYNNCEAKTRILKVRKIENPTYEILRQNLKETPTV